MNICISICLSVLTSILAMLLYKNKKHSNIVVEQLNEQITKYRHEAEEAIQKKIKAEADLDSRTALLTDVSHEIRSRLHGIVSLSEILSARWDEVKENDRKGHLNTIFEASFGLINFMNDLLDFSKFDAGKMVFHFHELDLAKSINEVIEYCRRVYLFEDKASLKIKNKIVGIAPIVGDKARINQLVMNLFINAIKYSEKGDITVELKRINYNGKSYWEFILSDHGIGIPKDELENIFELFTQSTRHRVGKKVGSGLGLAMCKQIVEAHSGSIWAENNSEGEGAKFSFIIPVLNKEKTVGGNKKKIAAIVN